MSQQLKVHCIIELKSCVGCLESGIAMAAPDVLPSDMETTDMEVDPSTQQEKLQAAVVNAVQEHYRTVFAEEADQGLRKFVDPCEYLHASFPDEASKMQLIQGMQDLEEKLIQLLHVQRPKFEETIPEGLPDRGISHHQVPLWKLGFESHCSVKGHHSYQWLHINMGPTLGMQVWLQE